MKKLTLVPCFRARSAFPAVERLLVWGGTATTPLHRLPLLPRSPRR